MTGRGGEIPKVRHKASETSPRLRWVPCYRCLPIQTLFAAGAGKIRGQYHACSAYSAGGGKVTT